MKTWQRTTPAQATAMLAVGLVAMPALMAASRPVAVHAVPVRVPRGPALTVSIGDGRVAARTGDKLSYTVTVRDTGTAAAAHLRINQTLSTGLEFLSASDHGAATSGGVSWSAGLPAGGTRTFHVVARVTKTPPTLLRLAAIACVTVQGSTRPVVCAAHLDRLPAVAKPGARSSQSTATVTYTAAGLAVLALAMLTAFAARRRARTRRQPA